VEIGVHVPWAVYDDGWGAQKVSILVETNYPLHPRLRSLMVRKWSTGPISLSYTTPYTLSKFGIS
jgi:hypothetical protein